MTAAVVQLLILYWDMASFPHLSFAYVTLFHC